MRQCRAWIALAALVMSADLLAQAPGDLAATLARVGQRVEQYYEQARSIVCIETVSLQPLGHDLSPDGFARRLVYELSVEWEPPPPGQLSGEAHVVRRLMTVNGRPPRPKDEPACGDPNPVSPEPLAVFLPSRRADYAFTGAGKGKTGGRNLTMVDYAAAAPKPPQSSWNKECVEIDVPAKTRGRAWVDDETGEVFRIDEHMTGQFEFRLPREHVKTDGPMSLVIERYDWSLEYRPVKFSDPDETVIMPASITSLQVVQNAGTPRLRTTQTFSNYRRFTTAGRIVR
jgi:hypothetical protein